MENEIEQTYNNYLVKIIQQFYEAERNGEEEVCKRIKIFLERKGVKIKSNEKS